MESGDLLKLDEKQARIEIKNFLDNVADVIDMKLQENDEVYELQDKTISSGDIVKRLKVITKLDFLNLLKYALNYRGIPISEIAQVKENDHNIYICLCNYKKEIAR